MHSAWRLVKAKYAESALDGEGARRFGGRWNHRGVPMVYLGGTLSLAALELFVHLTAEDARLKLVSIQIDIPDSVSQKICSVEDLPTNWREEPPPNDCKQLGSAWAKSAKSAVLLIPSVIIPSEYNVLLNPKHTDVAKLTIHKPKPFGFDSRMWK